MKVEVHISKLNPDSAADLVCKTLKENDDKAAAENAGESWAMGPGPLSKGEVRNIVQMLLTEHRHLLNDKSEKWLENFKEEY